MEQDALNEYKTAENILLAIHNQYFPTESKPINKKAALTKREHEVYELYLAGHKIKDIGEMLGISPFLVQNYVTRIRLKLKLS